MFKIKVEYLINKPAEAVFEAITDHANYKRFPGISGSRLLEKGLTDKNGEGALREIVSGPLKFVERITKYEPPYVMRYKIEDLSPFTIKHFKGEVTLVREGDNTRVRWISEGRANAPFVGPAIDKLVEMRVPAAFTGILSYIDNH